MNITFLYLFPYIYRENSKFLGKKEAFRKFTIREERDKKKRKDIILLVNKFRGKEEKRGELQAIFLTI